MRKVYSTIMLLAVMALALCYTSCSSNDHEEEGNETSIIGVWECISADYGELEEYGDDETRPGDLFYINADYTYYIVGHYNGSGRWSLSGKNFKMKPNMTNSFPITYTITQLTSSTLSLVLSEEFELIKVSFRRKQ